MPGSRGEELPPGLFFARPEHCPKNKDDLYLRLNYYTAWMGVAVSDALYDCLIELRRSAPSMPSDEVRRLALKGFTDEEYASAVKEMLCIWFHLEAMDQGGENAPDWLVSFLKQAFNASDYLIAEPGALEVLRSYENHRDTSSLCRAAAVKACRWLGFGEYSPGLSALLERVFFRTAPQRQQILEEALTLPIETVRSRPRA